MFRLTVTCAFAALLSLPAGAQESPAPIVPAPETQPAPQATDTPSVPLPIMPAESTGCSKTRQMTS